MARLANARNNHMTRWVIPVAKGILIEEACKNASTRPLGEVAHIEMGQSPDGDSCNDDGEGVPLIGGPADLGLEFPQTTRWTNSPTKLCRLGDIIVCVRATIGEPRWSDGIYCLGRGVAAIRPIENNLLPKFLFVIIEGNEQILRSKGTGTTFKTISKEHLASIQVPMIPSEEQMIIVSFLVWLEQNSNMRPNFSDAPPLPEILINQRRFVARIEELAARIEEARGLRCEVHNDCEELCRSILSDTLDGASTLTPMRELVKLRELDITVLPEEIYWFAGIYSFGKGLFRGQRKQGTEFSYTRLTRLKTDNFVYPKLMAWEGAFAVVPSECDGLVVSPEFPVFEIDQQRVLPETLEVYFHIPSVWSAISGASTGTNVRRRRLNPADFLAFEIPLPPMKTHKRLREVKAKLDSLNQLQSETSAELDALLPSILDKAFKGEL